MTIYCSSCGASLEGCKEGWYYCPEEDCEQYFTGDCDKTDSKEKR